MIAGVSPGTWLNSNGVDSVGGDGMGSGSTVAGAKSGSNVAGGRTSISGSVGVSDCCNIVASVTAVRADTPGCSAMTLGPDARGPVASKRSSDESGILFTFFPKVNQR